MFPKGKGQKGFNVKLANSPSQFLLHLYPNYLKILAFSVRIKGFRQGELEKAWLFHVDTI